MITDDGRLSFEIDVDPRRGFRHRLRHLVNPVVGIGCGLVFGAALFVVAVQGLFGVRPSVLAVLVALAALVVYGVAVLRARAAAAGRRAYRLVLSPRGVEVAGAGGSGGYAWPRFTRWLEDEADFVLTSGGLRGRMLIVLPKAGVAEEEQELIREVLHAHIDPDDEPLSDAFVEMGWDEEPARRAAD